MSLKANETAAAQGAASVPSPAALVSSGLGYVAESRCAFAHQTLFPSSSRGLGLQKTSCSSSRPPSLPVVTPSREAIKLHKGVTAITKSSDGASDGIMSPNARRAMADTPAKQVGRTRRVMKKIWATRCRRAPHLSTLHRRAPADGRRSPATPCRPLHMYPIASQRMTVSARLICRTKAWARMGPGPPFSLLFGVPPTGTCT